MALALVVYATTFLAGIVIIEFQADEDGPKIDRTNILSSSTTTTFCFPLVSPTGPCWSAALLESSVCLEPI
jgi:hypothetical protein